jgi:hypothetical protein
LSGNKASLGLQILQLVVVVVVHLLQHLHLQHLSSPVVAADLATQEVILLEARLHVVWLGPPVHLVQADVVDRVDRGRRSVEVAEGFQLTVGQRPTTIQPTTVAAHS